MPQGWIFLASAASIVPKATLPAVIAGVIVGEADQVNVQVNKFILNSPAGRRLSTCTVPEVFRAPEC